MKVKSIVLAVLFMLGVTACQKQELDPVSVKSKNSLEQSIVHVDPAGGESGKLKSATAGDWVAAINASLAEHNIQLEKMETLGAEQEGNTVFFKNVGNKQLSSDYVPDDPRSGNGISVPYVIDGTEMGTTSGMSESETQIAIISAMNTWGNNKCSKDLNIPYLGHTGFDIGYVQFLLGFGGIAGYYPGTISHGGVLPSQFFDALEAGGGSFILGVTFTFVWISPPDLDQNGKDDVAFKEIYINDGFNWQDAPDDVIGNGIYDFETVVFHEVGHGLSQGHFGKAFVSGNGKLHFSPAALMNSGYSVARRDLTKTDLAGHCSIWGDWPQN